MVPTTCAPGTIDPSIGRFISEDTDPGKVSDPLSLNYYTYCANNPILYVDPSGNYYIVQSNVASTIYLKKDNWFTSALKSVTGHFVPFGGVMNESIESRFFGVIGGNSATKYSAEDLALDAVGQLFSASGKQLLNVAYNIASGTKDFVGAIKGEDICRMDNIAFDIMDRSGVSTTAWLWESDKLDSMMGKAYSYIGNNYKYFSQEILNGKTLYQLHSMISNSKDPQSTISQIVGWYTSNLVAADPYPNIDLIKMYGNTFESTLLDDWQSTLDSAAANFKSYIEQ